MPLWTIYHPTEAFAEVETRQAFATKITSFYTAIGLPPFYVVVNFITVPKSFAWVGAEQPTNTFIRITISHLAARVPEDTGTHYELTASLERIMKPFIADKGYDYEYHIDQSERELWRINGFIPPPLQSEEEKVWARLNKAVPYDGHPVVKLP
ncbi:hypothetical protein S40285_06611 [Stachybotrys chlorohalonatus IBT 40285]|uniref:Tautomerase cis-CaaD-like domain-containing protein n=1 Tax=Stachybotrys chlorohalonatus (strain IBT 40285) TaxID=1283841 RepID=A0A084R1P1_STAC4|nr:hypothetical protein S40285_06611 [Stachybotrys chlorohalonata IBT 40285]